ncbi:hypothetical protein BJ170DRAFT_71219 [Xylariales sp. AK1849]|nr:hypothetical protein BJ170DRAFT_71219 [Xylariales sp. AK1849]
MGQTNSQVDHDRPTGSSSSRPQDVHSSSNDLGSSTQRNSQQPAASQSRTYVDATKQDAQDVDGGLPSPPIAVFQDERKTRSAPNAINLATQPARNLPTSPLASPLASPRARMEQRGSLQLPNARTMPTEPSNNVRQSQEFDRRYDGPFGRASLAMQRRRSSQPRLAEETTELDVFEPVVEPLVVADPDGTRVPGPAFRPEPPSLNYTLRTRKMAIFLFWAVIVFDSVVMPIVLYFGLWYGVGPGNPSNARLSANTVFTVVTAAIGGASIVEYFVRFWRLYKKDSVCTVIGAHRWYLDWFHWMFTLAWIIVMIELIIGSIQDDPYIRLLSMPLSTMLFVFGTLLIVIDVSRYFEIPAPVRISSIPKGAQLRPGIYSLIEDICAVDGSGRTDFRVDFDKRYEASHVFRVMLRRLGFFWAVGAEGCAVLCTILIFGLDSVDAAYAIGWSVPFIWGGIWTAATFWYAKRELKKERVLWAAEAAKCRA